MKVNSKNDIIILLSIYFLVIGLLINNIIGEIFSYVPEPIAPIKITNNHAFSNLQLGATAAIVYDLNTGKTYYNLNKDKKLPIASITKIMTALTSNDLISPYATITVGPISASSTYSETGGLTEGESWSLKELTDFTLIMSSNYAANLIAKKTEAITGQNFIAAMNQKAQNLGLNHTHFNNATGLDVSYDLAGSYSTAEDVAKLFAYVVKQRPDIIRNTRYQNTYAETEDGFRHYLINTNEVASRIPNLIASKTGYTYLAGGNLAVVFNVKPEHPVAVVVLGSGQQGRFSDTLALVKATVGYFNDNGL